jgi:hypothetical protein
MIFIVFKILGKFLDAYLTGTNFIGEARFPPFKITKTGYYMIKYYYNVYCLSEFDISDGSLIIYFNYGLDSYTIRHYFNNAEDKQGKWILIEIPLLIKSDSTFLNVKQIIILINSNKIN